MSKVGKWESGKVGNLVAYPYEKMLTRSPEKDDYFPELVDSIPEKVDVLIWLSQILALILYTITTNPLKMQYMTNIKQQEELAVVIAHSWTMK